MIRKQISYILKTFLFTYLKKVKKSFKNKCQPQAYTMGIAELRRSVDAGSSDEVRPVPLLEREDRRSQQATRLRGVECEALYILRAFNMS